MKIQLHAQDIQLERFFLALIRYRPAWEATHGMISPSYFSSDDRRKIYAAISTAYEADAFLDRVTLPLLSGKASSDEIGYLNIQPEDIDRDAPSIAAYMADRYARRKALEEAIKYYDCQSSYESLLNSLGELEGDATATKPAPLETGDQWMAKEAAQFRSIGRLATGFQHLDQYLNWSPGNIYVLTADTGKGKTLMAHELAFGYAHTHGEIAGIIGLELSREEVAFRWEQSRTVEDAAYIHHPKRTNWTPTSACREITNRAKQGVRFWVVDHFMLFSKDDGKQNQTEFEANTARQLERCAKATGAIVLVVGQYSKAGAVGADMKPSIHHLKGAKALADIAAGVAIIDHDEDPANMSALYLGKNRFGRSGVNVGCRFLWDRMRVEFCEYSEMSRTSRTEKKGGRI